jgi:hypothetical protein
VNEHPSQFDEHDSGCLNDALIRNGVYGAQKYIDDHGMIGPRFDRIWCSGYLPEMACDRSLELLKAMFAAMNILGDDKGNTLGPRGVFLGSERDIAAGRERVHQVKLKAAGERAANIKFTAEKRGTHYRVKDPEELATFAYKTNYFCRSLFLGRMHLDVSFCSLSKSLNDLHKIQNKPDFSLLLDDEIYYWNHIAPVLNIEGVPLPHFKPQKPFISNLDNRVDARWTDPPAGSPEGTLPTASFGFFCLGQVFWGEFSETEIKLLQRHFKGNPVMGAEALAVVKMAVTFGPGLWKGRLVDIGEDNDPVRCWLAHQKARHPYGSGMLKTVGFISLANGFDFTSTWIPTAKNIIADASSRLSIEPLTQLHRLMDALKGWQRDHQQRTGIWREISITKLPADGDTLFAHHKDRAVWVEATLAAIQARQQVAL